MMAVADRQTTSTRPRRFSAARYAEMINDRSEYLTLEQVLELLDREYRADSVHLWRRRGTAEGGYGPMGLPEPDQLVPRGDAAPSPQWFRGTIARWAMQTGRMHLVTFTGQQPRRAGRGGKTAVA